MTSTTLESKEVFRTRAVAIGLDSATLAALIAAGVDTLSKLQFSSAYQLGQSDDTVLLAVVSRALGAGAVVSAPDAAAIRRLFFEAATLTMSELKATLERHDESPAKKIPQPERVARYRAQVQRLPGLRLVGELECSNALIDLVFQQSEDEIIRYLAPSKCTRRSQELLGLPKESRYSTDLNGFIKERQHDASLAADVSTEMRTRYALTRRALAYDQVGLCDFHVLDGWSDFLWEQMMRPPPVGYTQISLDQVLQADRAIFLVLAELTREGITIRPTGVKPIEAAFPTARLDPQVAMLLQPLALSQRSAPFTTPQVTLPSPPGQGKKALKRAAAQAKAAASAPYAKPAGVIIPKGKGKGGKSAGKGSKGMPAELAGMADRTSAGEPICFKFNMAGGCPYGTNCRNKNVCCVPGCFSPDHNRLTHT